MKEVIVVHVLNNLHEDDPLNDLAEDAEDCYRPIVLGFQFIIFLKKWNNLGHLVK